MNSSIIERLTSAGRLDRMFIGGEWVLPAGQARSLVIDPSTEEPVAEIALGSAQDVAAAVAAARRAFATWSVSSAQSRASLLDRVHALILERAELFAQAISLEMGAAIGLARSTQVPIAAEHIRVARDHRGQLSLCHPSGRHGHHARGHRRVRPDHPLELAALPDHRQGRPRPGGGLHRRPEAQRAVAPERLAVRGSDARRRHSRRVCSTSSTAKGRRSAPRWPRTLTWT